MTMTRFISIILTAVLATQMALVPAEIRNHALLPLMIFGLLIGLFHSLDFSLSHPIRKHLFGPVVAWPIMAASIFYFLSQTGFI